MGDIPIIFINTLRSLRVKFGYTQEEAAQLIGVSVPTLRSWEQNSNTIPYMVIKKIESVYRTPQDYIFFGNEVSFREQLKNKHEEAFG
ncbi:helix-turn-helix protein [compost metagenome]